MNKVLDLLDLSKRMDGLKAPWLSYWQQLGDVLLPNKADFTRGNRSGKPRTDSIYDGTPRLAARRLATAIDGLLKPKTARWFSITLDDRDIAEIDEVKLWLEAVADRMWQAIYRKDARFAQRSAEVDESLVVFGTGVLFIGENKARTGLLFKSFELNDVAIGEDADHSVTRWKVDEYLSPVQAIGRWGEGKLHSEVIGMANDVKRADTKLCFTQIVVPRDDYDAGRFDERGMAYSSCVIDVKHEHKVTDEGFHEFPVAVPRWETASGEAYGRSPGMMALPDSKTLQAMGKTLLVAGQKAVDPPTWAYNDAVLSPIRTFPGGHISLDASASAHIGGGAPIGVLDMGKNMPLGLDMQTAVRAQVEAAFLKDVFSLPVQTRQMTATEILERREEFMRTIGPVFGRLESDYIGHVVERVFGIMHRAGQFPPFPDIGDAEVRIEFRYMSPVQKARKEMELAALGRAMEILTPLVQIDPGVVDNIDADQIVRDLPEAGGIPQKWLRTRNQVEEIRAQRQQIQELQSALAAAQPVSSSIKNIADAGSTVAGMAGPGGTGENPAALPSAA